MTDAPLTITVSGPRTPLRTKWLAMLRDLVGSAVPHERPQILDAAPGHADSVRAFHQHQAARPETTTPETGGVIAAARGVRGGEAGQ